MVTALPILEETAVVGGGRTTAALAAGATSDGRRFKTDFRVDEVVEVLGEILPENDHLYKRGGVFIVVHVHLATGHSAWFQKDVNGRFQRWEGKLTSLQPAEELDVLSEVHQVEVYEGRLPPGEYKVYFGYMAEDETLVYSATPLEIRVE